MSTRLAFASALGSAAVLLNGAILADETIDRSRVEQGFASSPIPPSQLSLNGKDIQLIGLGSCLINTAGDCSSCHTFPITRCRRREASPAFSNHRGSVRTLRERGQRHGLRQTWRIVMPKYLFQATYSAEGVKGLEKDKAVGRKAALSKAIESLGGKLEALYWAFGEHDWVLLADLPDNASATAFSLAVSGSGLLRVVTTTLVSAEETDSAFQKKVNFQAPGRLSTG
jgi:uncharacterized protein with GYD domain